LPQEQPGTGIAVPIVDLRAPLKEQVAAARAAGAAWVELRVDRIGDPTAVSDFIASAPDIPLIVTVRSASEGGAWNADEQARLALLARLRPASGFSDVERASWEDYQRVASAGGGFEPRRCIVSSHDLSATPESVEAVLKGLHETGAGVIKAVLTPRDATDGLRILAALRVFAGVRPTIALGMGAAGLLTRVLARKFGAALTFAALRADAQSAPGQPTIAELRGVYRWDAIGPATRVYGVVGWPVAHSRSPQIHNAALATAGIDGVYVPMPVAPGGPGFAAFMNYVDAHGWLDLDGLSVTLPHKENALHWLLERGFAASETARRCGAVNTLTRVPGGWHGDNTDGAGAVRALLAHPGLTATGLPGRTAAILGAGGVARSVAAALLESGVRVTLYNRSPERAARLASALGCAWEPWERRSGCKADILVNCTQVGMWPDIHETPLDLSGCGGAGLVFDTIYNPPQTRLLREAARSGRQTLGGVEMFIAQAAGQFERWHARTAPLVVMRAALGA